MRCVLLQPLKYIISLKVVPDGMFERLGEACLSIQSERETIKEVVVKITGWVEQLFVLFNSAKQSLCRTWSLFTISITSSAELGSFSGKLCCLSSIFNHKQFMTLTEKCPAAFSSWFLIVMFTFLLVSPQLWPSSVLNTFFVEEFI